MTTTSKPPQRSTPNPSTPGETPADKPVTLTMAKLDELVAQRVAAALQTAGVPAARATQAPAKPLPTLEEAKAMVAVDVARGIAVKGVETTEGWYVHPLANLPANGVNA